MANWAEFAENAGRAAASDDARMRRLIEDVLIGIR
jgi:hypothetical protein